MTQLFEDNKASEQSEQFTQLKISEWIVDYMSDLLEIEPDEVDVETTFARYGLDSSAAVILTGDLGNWLGKEIEPTVMYDYPTISKLAEYVAEEN
ncbi:MULTISPECIES: acyl carrier protein [unclassified Nodularia (in: cyanobacteria)]|uniref:acyl carrier protein n=1 Tax=unclassified Nodularia (in: cyanobacteria) TaxID=2656917 RepID=UPI00187E6847|nr:MULTISPECIES: acyl carrier protein [unclassified Nodularia (in: cyanobacteria)]MBE9201729.1 acyl carrier protein [Nodularia sp. LEGE 06071]MCC2691242.1 acyl carrier protein [Nodularia sp. LEGE 04288]QOV09191.1 ClyB/NocM [Nodularia sp. LEGE 06071]